MYSKSLHAHRVNIVIVAGEKFIIGNFYCNKVFLSSQAVDEVF